MTTNKNSCTGCGACIQKCPVQCISWQEHEFGFRYPVIDESKCYNCGMCDEVCPIGKVVTGPQEQKAYAAVIKDEACLRQSTSGGAFSVLAEYVLERNGTVYGCSFEDELQARHIRIDQIESLGKLRGSKYVQSDINMTYVQVENDLKEGRFVLFTGTPCQIGGLRSFLNAEYENLITADIVCHGVGSQKYFDQFVDFLKQRYERIDELHFRSKKYTGWSCGGSITGTINGKTVHSPFFDYNNYYYYYYLHGDIYRESCYICSYANLQRPGDFTLGDFWGIEALKLPIATDKGCSLLLVNTPKARKLLHKLGNIDLVEVPLADAVSKNGQLNYPSAASSIRHLLSEQYKTMSGVQINKDFRKRNRIAIAKLYLKSLVPYRIKLIIRKMRK